VQEHSNATALARKRKENAAGTCAAIAVVARIASGRAKAENETAGCVRDPTVSEAPHSPSFFTAALWEALTLMVSFLALWCQDSACDYHIKYWETIADKLRANGWSWGYCHAATRHDWRFIVEMVGYIIDLTSC
jgi:hypothetical protein